MEYATETFDGHVPVALPEGRFPADTGSPPSFARPGGPRSAMGHNEGANALRGGVDHPAAEDTFQIMVAENRLIW